MSIEMLKVVQRFLERVTHWTEGVPDLHDIKFGVRAAIAEQEKAQPVASPTLPDWLLNLIGDYGFARSNRLGEVECIHRWQLLIAGIKQYTHPAPSAPAGYVLVPVEPTEEMVGAAFDLFEMPHIEGYKSGNDVRTAIYRAMLAAAPKVQSAPPSDLTETIAVNLVREGINKHRARELARHFVGLITSAPLTVDPFENTSPGHPRDKCWCEACDLAFGGLRTRMSICPDCGDKRCPKAHDHKHRCAIERRVRGTM